MFIFFFRLTDEAGTRVNKGYNNEISAKILPLIRDMTTHTFNGRLTPAVRSGSGCHIPLSEGRCLQ